MSEHTVFQCDGCGERFGAKNDVWTFPVKRRSTVNPFKISEYDTHLCLDCETPGTHPHGTVDYIAVEGGGVVGVKLGDETTMRERDEPVIDHYEPFLQWFEEEVIV